MDVIFDFLDKYGWGGIIMLAVGLMLFCIEKLITNKLTNDVTTGLEIVGKQLTDQISQQNDQLLNVIVTQQHKILDSILNRKTIDEQKHNDMLFDKIKIAEEINVARKEIMWYHNAQRVYIIEFHNSNSNLSGVRCARYSCTYEWHDRGVYS